MSRPGLSLVLLLSSLLLSACATSPSASHATQAGISHEGTRLYYDGELSAEANAKIIAAYQAAREKPNTLLINSSGGDVELGMALGRFVHEHQLNVQVRGECASSCANYVFPAGKSKILEADSILLWHGGTLQPDTDAVFRAKHQQLQQEEKAYFELIGVKQLITVCGQHPRWVKDFPQPIGWDYSLADLKAFGLDHIVLVSGRWRPHAFVKDPKFFRAEACDSTPAPIEEILCGCHFA